MMDADMSKRILLGILFIVVVILIIATIVPLVSSQASVNKGNYALNWAESHAMNAPYSWGGTGPSYDCSGLVMEAVGHGAGIWLPHNTEAMIQSGKLYWVPLADRERGDLLFWFSGGYAYHVEIMTAWRNEGFGAETYGWAGRVTWHLIWGQPSVYRLR